MPVVFFQKGVIWWEMTNKRKLRCDLKRLDHHSVVSVYVNISKHLHFCSSRLKRSPTVFSLKGGQQRFQSSVWTPDVSLAELWSCCFVACRGQCVFLFSFADRTLPQPRPAVADCPVQQCIELRPLWTSVSHLGKAPTIAGWLQSKNRLVSVPPRCVEVFFSPVSITFFGLQWEA